MGHVVKLDFIKSLKITKFFLHQHVSIKSVGSTMERNIITKSLALSTGASRSRCRTDGFCFFLQKSQQIRFGFLATINTTSKKPRMIAKTPAHMRETKSIKRRRVGFVWMEK